MKCSVTTLLMEFLPRAQCKHFRSPKSICKAGVAITTDFPLLCACRQEGKTFVLVLPFMYISIQNTMKFRLGWEWPARGTQRQCCLQYGCTSVHPGHSGQPGRKSLTESGLTEPQSTLCLQNPLKNPILSYRKEGTAPMTHGLPLPEGQRRQNGDFGVEKPHQLSTSQAAKELHFLFNNFIVLHCIFGCPDTFL